MQSGTQEVTDAIWYLGNKVIWYQGTDFILYLDTIIWYQGPERVGSNVFWDLAWDINWYLGS